LCSSDRINCPRSFHVTRKTNTHTHTHTRTRTTVSSRCQTFDRREKGENKKGSRRVCLFFGVLFVSYFTVDCMGGGGGNAPG
jgi:hypothetical protein